MKAFQSVREMITELEGWNKVPANYLSLDHIFEYQKGRNILEWIRDFFKGDAK